MAEVVNANSSFGQILVKLESFDQLPETRKKIEEYLNDYYPDAKSRTKVLFAGPPIKYKIEARFSGPDPKVLRQLAEQAEAIMHAEPWAKNVGNDWRQKVMVWNTSYSQTKARRCGVSREDVANALSGANYGSTIGMFKEDNKQLPIILKTNEEHEGDPGFLENISVYGDGPKSTVLSQIADDFNVGWEDPVIYRYNRRRAIIVRCDPISENITGDQLQARIADEIESIPLPEGYELMWDGEYKPQKDANSEIGAYFPLAIVLMVFVIVILFNSVRQTLIVFLLLPLSLIGVANGLFVLDKAFGFMAIVGFLGLLGMIIKNAVVLIDQINILLKDGKTPYQAVVESAISRMRPVMMASMTTILGMLPLITDAMYGSMAATVMFGLLFATVLTLIVVPVLYVVFYRIRVE
jgi:multidrug efflux pump subunit AcrB